MRRPQPPYAREVTARLADVGAWRRRYGSNADSVFVAAGGPAAWSWARQRLSSYLVLVAPADRDPAEFDWSMVAPQAPATVVPFDCGDDFAERLAVAILRDGSGRVVVTRLDRGVPIVYARAAA